VRIDVLINNAGVHVESIEGFPPEKRQQLIDIMLIGPARQPELLLLDA
jgi:3-hydroxybutyrate dehydrogenase